MMTASTISVEVSGRMGVIAFMSRPHPELAVFLDPLLGGCAHFAQQLALYIRDARCIDLAGTQVLVEVFDNRKSKIEDVAHLLRRTLDVVGIGAGDWNAVRGEGGKDADDAAGCGGIHRGNDSVCRCGRSNRDSAGLSHDRWSFRRLWLGPGRRVSAFRGRLHFVVKLYIQYRS